MSAETQTAPRVGAHRKSRPSAAKVHGKRITWFSLIGAFVFCMGTALQWMLIRSGAGTTWSYAWQSVFSIELSFVLNRTLTWGDRAVGVFGPLVKWNVQKLALTVPNFAAYALLVHEGLSWLAANLAVTAVFTVLNYIGGDLWSFREHRVSPLHWAMGILWCFLAPFFAAYAITRSAAIVLLGSPARRPPDAFTDSQARGIETLAGLSGTQEMERWARTALPTVSVIVPCKDNPGTIRETVGALLGQDYPGLEEVILVGSVGDTTWRALVGIGDPRLTFLEQGYTPGTRDPAVKRDKGIGKASGDVLALADSDIVMEPGWLTAGVGLLLEQGSGVVAGGMKSIHDTFWGRFVDRNRLARKTPRIPQPYQVTAANFGKRGYKPPVTANVIFTRDVYESAPIDTSWSYGYEDYEWFWRVAKAGHPILLTSELDGRHHHRRSFRHLAREYQRAADGCARFVHTHPDSPLARKRLIQAIGIPLAALASVVAAAVAVLTGHAVDALAAEAVVGTGLAGRELLHSRRLESVAYPVAGTLLGAVFTTSLIGGLVRADRSSVLAEEVPARRAWRQRACWPLVAMLALQAGLSLSLFWRNTAFSDEALYLWAGHLEWVHWLDGTPYPTLGSLQFNQYFSGAPQIYPPIGALADSAGHLFLARLLSLFFMLNATVLLYAIGRQLFDKATAIIACAVWITCEPCLKLGAFATYDAMSITLICLGAWVAIRATGRLRGERIALAAALLTLGGITAYSYLIYIPAMIAVIVAAWAPGIGLRKACVSAAWLAAGVAAFFIAAATLLKLWPGLLFTVFDRHVLLQQGYELVAASTWAWQGIVMCLALVGVLVALSTRQRLPLVLILAVSCLIVPLQQARIQSGVSLDKHLSLGIWLASMAAGYGVAAFARAPVAKKWLVACSCVVIAFPAAVAWNAAQWSFRGWNNATSLVDAFDKVTANATGNMAVENTSDVAVRYYTSRGRNWIQWANRWGSIGLTTHASIAEYKTLLVRDDLSVVAVKFDAPDVLALTHATLPVPRTGTQGVLDGKVVGLLAGTSELNNLVRALVTDPNYRIAAVVSYGKDLGQTPTSCVIWKRIGSLR